MAQFNSHTNIRFWGLEGDLIVSNVSSLYHKQYIGNLFVKYLLTKFTSVLVMLHSTPPYIGWMAFHCYSKSHSKAGRYLGKLDIHHQLE